MRRRGPFFRSQKQLKKSKKLRKVSCLLNIAQNLLKSFAGKGISSLNLRASVSRLQISTFGKTRLVTPRSRTDLSSWRILRQTLNAVDPFESHFSLQRCQHGLSCDVFVHFLRQVCRSLGNGRSFETRKSFPKASEFFWN